MEWVVGERFGDGATQTWCLRKVNDLTHHRQIVSEGSSVELSERDPTMTRSKGIAFGSVKSHGGRSVVGVACRLVVSRQRLVELGDGE